MSLLTLLGLAVIAGAILGGVAGYALLKIFDAICGRDEPDAEMTPWSIDP